eukprot:scaffold45083_cov88-Phaeocystis_antarctica.AAC.1
MYRKRSTVCGEAHRVSPSLLVAFLQCLVLKTGGGGVGSGRRLRVGGVARCWGVTLVGAWCVWVPHRHWDETEESRKEGAGERERESGSGRAGERERERERERGRGRVDRQLEGGGGARCAGDGTSPQLPAGHARRSPRPRFRRR